MNFQQETICVSMHIDDERWEVDDDNAILKSQWGPGWFVLVWVNKTGCIYKL